MIIRKSYCHEQLAVYHVTLNCWFPKCASSLCPKSMVLSKNTIGMKEELSHSGQKEWAKLLYTKHDKSIRDIALEVEAEEATVRQWIMADKWDGMKTSL